MATRLSSRAALFAAALILVCSLKTSAQNSVNTFRIAEPCGYVDFIPFKIPTIDSTGRRYEHISLVVHFADGSTQSVDLDYPFVYASTETDPFVPRNANLPALFQFPPPGSNVPDLLAYVIRHTTPEGYTKLKPCPDA